MYQGEARGSTVAFEKESQNKVVLDGASSTPMILDSALEVVFILGQFPSFLGIGAELKLVFNSPQEPFQK